METLDAEISNRFAAQAAAQWNVHLNQRSLRFEPAATVPPWCSTTGRRSPGSCCSSPRADSPTPKISICIELESRYRQTATLPSTVSESAAPGVWALGDCQLAV